MSAAGPRQNASTWRFLRVKASGGTVILAGSCEAHFFDRSLFLSPVHLSQLHTCAQFHSLKRMKL